MASAVHIFFTASERTYAMTLDDTSLEENEINPRWVDAPNPGVWQNINGNATNYDPLETIVLDDPLEPMYAIEIVNKNNLDFIANCPLLIAYFDTLPWAMVDTDVIFAPYIPEE
jgi:hypothetical protein